MAGSPTSAPVPREVLRSAFYTVANYFDAIRREWIAGDSEQLRLLASGFGSETNGYAELMRHKVRAGVAQHWQKLRDDADFLPFVLRYCDPSLRDSIQRLIRLTDLDAFHADRYGETSERWRQTWPAMDLDGELDELLPKLRAAGDAMMLPTAPTIDPGILARLEASIAAVHSIGSNFDAGMARVGRMVESVRPRDDDDVKPATDGHPRTLASGDNGEYRPATWFPKGMADRLRQAASKKRKTKRVATRTVDGVVCYSVADARRWWPTDVPKEA